MWGLPLAAEVGPVTGLPVASVGAAGLPLAIDGATGLPVAFDGATGLPDTMVGETGLPVSTPGDGGSGLPLPIVGRTGLPEAMVGARGLPETSVGAELTIDGAFVVGSPGIGGPDIVDVAGLPVDTEGDETGVGTIVVGNTGDEEAAGESEDITGLPELGTAGLEDVGKGREGGKGLELTGTAPEGTAVEEGGATVDGASVVGIKGIGGPDAAGAVAGVGAED